MKKFCSTVFLLTVLFNFTFAQCNEFYQIENGSEWELENYNAKGKLTGKTQQKVTSYNASGSGYTAQVHSVMVNDKGKEQFKGDLEMKCEGGTFFIDMKNFVSEEQLKSLGSYETKVEATNLEVPSKLSVGQSLKDGSITVTALNAGIPIKIAVNITNRKVVGQESITTPAGTFNCYKITSDMHMQTQMALNVNSNFSSTEWIAPKVATVKSETYNKSGKLMGYSVLAKRK